MTEQEQICALKAQVNCLRNVLIRICALDTFRVKSATYVAEDGLRQTPEKCLVEVKAKAIEEYKQEQAEMKQMELATKLMVSSI